MLENKKKIEYLLNYRWIGHYYNGQSLTTETRSQAFLTQFELDERVNELLKQKEPDKGMVLEYTRHKITTERLK